MTSKALLQFLEKEILSLRKQKTKPLRIAINGIEGTGKTTLADQLCLHLNANQHQTVQISIDGYHFNKQHRYRQGRDSAMGYYEDSYDEISFRDKVLLASQSNNPNYIAAIHDLETDEYLQLFPIPISNDTIIITDGSYLFKPVYRDHWDLKIYLKTDFNTALQRGINRDQLLLGGMEEAASKFNSRYHKASKIYIEQNNPELLADIIIDYTDFYDIYILKP